MHLGHRRCMPITQLRTHGLFLSFITPQSTNYTAYEHDQIKPETPHVCLGRKLFSVQEPQIKTEKLAGGSPVVDANSRGLFASGRPSLSLFWVVVGNRGWR